jgi:GAF domain-containing protein/nitrogen-specific signal transduction histidine kinase
MFASLNLGIGLVIAGLVFVILVWGLVTLLPHGQAAGQTRAPVTPFETYQSTDAIIVIQPGGRVDYINARAREWFGLQENDQPDLERLLRRVRPSDDFLNVCAVPGQKRLSLNGRQVEATSYQVPGAYPQILVSLRGMDFLPALQTGDNEISSSILKMVTDFSQSVASSLDFESVVSSILDNVYQLVPADLLEVKTWDADKQAFVAYRYQDANGLGRKLVSSTQSQFGDFSARLIETRTPLLIAEAAAGSGSQGGSTLARLASYVGLPLMAGSELVGFVEAGQTRSSVFTPGDFDLLKLVIGQAGVALHNALVYEQERKRTIELSGLANLAQAVSAIREPQELFSRLVESVTPLFNAEIVGFLLYDENKHTLEGQVPFLGVPSHIVRIYRTSIPPNSPAEALLRERKPILTRKAAQDENWGVLGLTDIAVAASLRDSALMPLVSAGQMVGFLQVSHHRNGSPDFSDSELRLMHIVSDQAAAIIENALLVRQSRERTQRADSLRRISSLSVSTATLEEVLKYSVQELAGLFQADAASIFLLDEARGDLCIHHASLHGFSEEAAGSFPSLVIDDPEFHDTASGSERAFRSGRLSVDPRLLSFYRPLVTNLGLESVLIVPLVLHEKSLGELMLGSRKADLFNDYDLQVVKNAAGQLAAAIESSHLVSQTDESLRRRVDQLTSVARVSREMGASLSIDDLLKVIHRETLRSTEADCGSITLLDTGETGQGPQVLQFEGCPTGGELTALKRTAIDHNEPVLVENFDLEDSATPHEGIRTALVVPISLRGKVLGLIELHAAAPAAFDESVLETAQTLAIQAAISLNNARQYREEREQAELLQRRAETLKKFSAASFSLSPLQTLDESLTSIARGIQDSTPFRVVLISLYEPETGMLRRATGVGLAPETMAELLARRQPLASLKQLMKPEFKVGRSYYIPADQTPVLPTDVHYVYASRYSEAQAKENAWHPDDFLLTPLEDPEGHPLGLISLDDPGNGLRPDRATLDSLELFAAQAAQVINNHLQFGELHRRIDSLNSGLQRQQKLLKVTQNDLPVLLRKDLEQTISMHNLDHRAQRVRAGLAITESVSHQLDASSALLALGRETLTQLGMSIALVAENTSEGPRLLHVLGSIPRPSNPEALFGQRNPLRAVLQSGQPILVSNLEYNDEWRDTPLLAQMHAKSVICLPVLVENRPIAAMLALNSEPMPDLTEEDRQVFLQISRQTSVVLQNISLLSETRRRLQEVNLLLEFSRKLSGLDPNQIVKALLDSGRRVLQAAHAGAVLLWNEQSQSLEATAVAGYADNDSLMHITYRRGEALPGSVFAEGKPRRIDEVNFSRDYVLTSDNLGYYRQGTGGRLPVSSLLVPIMTGEQGIGLLVLDNFNTISAFRPEDEELMVSLSQQVALSLQNVRLVHAMTERAGQLQALNDVATAMTSSLRSDELVVGLLEELAPVLPFDTATLWLRDKDRLTVAAARGFPDTEKRLGLTIAVSDSALFREMVKSGQPILVGDVREDLRFPSVEAPRLSWLGIPMTAKGELVGLIALEKWQAHFYTHDQIQLGTTFASQAAIALENANLYENSLSHADELSERSQRLALLNRFSSALSGLLDAGQILDLTAQELQQSLNVTKVSAVSFERGQARCVAAYPRVDQALPLMLPDAPLFARLRESHGVFITEKVKRELDLIPLRDFIGPDVRALLAVPLVSGQNLLALLMLEIAGERSFTAAEVELARTIANQAAIGLENARLYQSTVRTAERFAVLNQASAEIGVSLEPDEIYASIHGAAERLMPVDAFIISLLDEEKQEVESVYLMDLNQRWPNMRVPLGDGLSSRVIMNSEPVLLNNTENAEVLGGLMVGERGGSVSTLAVPMILGGRTIGILSAQSYQANVYTEEDLQILSTLANQAGVAIQNGRLFGETQRLAQELEQRVIERTAQLRREQQNTETLLRILTEVSSSLDLDRALNRTLSLLNEAVGADQGTIMLLNAEDNLLHYRAGYGYVSDKTGSDRGLTLKIGEGLAGWVVENREATLAADLYKDPRWVRSGSTSGQHRSAIVAPLLVSEDVIGVLLVFSRTENYFTPDSLNLVKAIAGQVAVAINNAHLYELIRDQAERLGLMLRKEQEEASRSHAILEAVADGVLVTGPNNRITFLNSSVQNLLSIKANRVMGQSLDDFGGLFSKAGLAWMETIRRWSKMPGSYEIGDTYAEQLELGDDRIVLVHLAPVMMQKEFLGTVSIFRDITHEVEVDRLKSEFVATVSHELRTPMTAIKGYVDILMMGAAGAINENQAHFLDIVKNNIDRLNILVSDLLDISSIEAGRVTLTRQPLDIRQIARSAIADFQHRSEEDKKPMTFTLEVPKVLPRVHGDAERLKQVMLNLLDNAYHYTPENGKITVHLHSLNGNGAVQVDVKDTGVGIAKADQDRIFERFYRGEHPLVLATPGTGLGLAIVRQLVEMHDGRIWLKSNGVPGEGSTFSFTIPVSKEKS